MRVNLSRSFRERKLFEVEQMSDGSVMNVFTDTVSISAEDLASMAALEQQRVYHRSLNVMQISNAVRRVRFVWSKRVLFSV
jgi:hypothetical protein